MDSRLDKEFSENLALSLMSKFCDSRLQELSNQCPSPGESFSPSQKNSLYSDVLTRSDHDMSPSYKPKRREHQLHSGSYDASNNTDCGDAEAQNLKVERNLILSKHVKSHKLSEFINTEPIEDDDDIQVVDQNNDNCHETEILFPGLVKPQRNELRIDSDRERLNSYLLTLKQRVSCGKWATTNELPFLRDLVIESCLPNHLKNSASDDKHESNTPKQGAPSWDIDQALLISSTDEIFVCYGIIDKLQAVKPQRLKKIFDHIAVAPLPLQSMATPKPELYLQDGTARIKLIDVSGKLRYGDVVPGIPVAIIGRCSRAALHAEDVIFATTRPPEWPLPQINNIEMVFVSGLFVGSEEGSRLALELLQDYLLGLSGSAFEQKEILAGRSRLLILGNMVSKSESGQKSSLESVTKVCRRNMNKLDDFLEPLLHSMEVFLIPGENDLTFTTSLPQPPIHQQLLTESTGFRTLKRLTNPARIELSASPSQTHPQSQGSVMSNHSLMENSYSEFLKEDVHFLDMVLQSGKNVKHTMGYCDVSCPIEMGRRLLEWAHLHPTSRDCDSLLGQNIFRLHGMSPHLMVMGNLSEFKSIEWNGTKIIGVPSFQKTHTAVVLTKDFDVIPLRFKLA